MKQLFALFLTIFLVLLTSCGQQASVTSVVSSSSNIANTVTSNIKELTPVITSQMTSYPSSSKTISSKSSSAPVVSVDRTPFYLNIPIDGVIQLTFTRLSGYDIKKSDVTQDPIIIQSIIEKINELEFVESDRTEDNLGGGIIINILYQDGNVKQYRDTNFCTYTDYGEQHLEITDFFDLQQFVINKMELKE